MRETTKKHQTKKKNTSSAVPVSYAFHLTSQEIEEALTATKSVTLPPLSSTRGKERKRELQGLRSILQAVEHGVGKDWIYEVVSRGAGKTEQQRALKTDLWLKPVVWQILPERWLRAVEQLKRPGESTQWHLMVTRGHPKAQHQPFHTDYHHPRYRTLILPLTQDTEDSGYTEFKYHKAFNSPLWTASVSVQEIPTLQFHGKVLHRGRANRTHQERWFLFVVFQSAQEADRNNNIGR